MVDAGATEMVPGRQSVHEQLPSTELLPLAHATHPELRDAALDRNPAEQRVQLAEPAAFAIQPHVQSAHELCPALPFVLVPTEHGVKVVEATDGT